VAALGTVSASGSVVGKLLKERRQTLAIAESSAGGLIDANMWTFARRAAELLGSCLRKAA